MTAPVSNHIDLDQVAETPWACGPYARRALVAATRALLAVVEAERLDRFEPDELSEPWASALAAAAPFREEGEGWPPADVEAGQERRWETGR